MFKKLKDFVQPLAKTPFHPQWLVSGRGGKLLTYLRDIDEGSVVLDIGCFDKWPKAFIPKSCVYYGLDYYETAKNWYETVPDLYGDALQLPLQNESINAILLLDVLEHIPNSDILLEEAKRTLTPGGALIMQVPFLYPLHDEPRDFFRITAHGFKALAQAHGFTVEECNAVGHPLETSALLSNIAMSKTIIGWMKAKNPAAILVLLLPPFVLLTNIFSRMLALISKKDNFMPLSYQLIFKKNPSD